MRLIDGDALLKRVWSEKIQAQSHGREFSTCFMSPGGAASTEWWFVEDLIENAPTIEPERKKGEWIEDGYNHYKAICSECGEPCGTYVMGEPRDRFCKWCGADMRKEGEKDDRT